MGEEPRQMGKYEMGTKDRIGESEGRGALEEFLGWDVPLGPWNP